MVVEKEIIYIFAARFDGKYKNRYKNETYISAFKQKKKK